jgi:superoxide dismutase, Fe-Mn family
MSDDAKTIAAETLRQWLAAGRRLALLDVRRAPIYAEANDMLPGAVWRDPFAVAAWRTDLDRTAPVVVYCVHGHEISRNAAAALTAAGIEAYTLAGGIEGWRKAGGATAPKAAP